MRQSISGLGVLLWASVMVACGGSAFETELAGAGASTPAGGKSSGGSSFGGSTSGGSTSGGSSSGGTSVGGSTSSGGSFPGGTDSGGFDSGGSAAGGSQAGGSGGSAVGGNGSGATCSGYDDLGSSEVSVKLVNSTTVPVYLGDEENVGCGQSQLYQVFDGAGRKLNTSAPFCSGTCQNLIESGDLVCAAACAAPTVTKLDPGKSVKLGFDSVYRERMLPTTCIKYSQAMDGTRSCVQRSPLPAGVLGVVAKGYTSYTCTLSTCDCYAGPLGAPVCPSYSASLSGPIQAEAKIEYPREGLVVVEFK